MAPDLPDYEQLGREVVAYCKKYNIRIEDFFPILNDQKVIPMLRGKAAEYDAVFILRQVLGPIFGLHTVFITIAPETILYVHNA